MSAPGETWVRWRVRLGYPVALIFFCLAHPSPGSLAAGAVIAAAGLAVRGAAAGHLRKHAELATSGPYGYTRNPLYLGSAVLAGGFLVAGQSWIAAAAVLVYFATFYWVVMKREETELRARYGSVFDEYAARVPLFFPWPGTSTQTVTPFSWKQYRSNREYQAAIGWATGLALLYGKMIWN